MKNKNINTALKYTIACLAVGIPTMIMACKADEKTTQTTQKTEKFTEAPVTITAKPTNTTTQKDTKQTPEVSWVKDTALVLYYFPRTYGRGGTLIVTNKHGKRSSYNPDDIPVQRGDEIIYETRKIDGTRYFKLIQNITMNRLEKEYMKKR
ncbi:MAG: hypothetical protein IJD41_00850 [Alphaproteobacteria bacterium]|nr:hypothetical protein [Alphaproteobacteria bacterium]